MKLASVRSLKEELKADLSGAVAHALPTLSRDHVQRFSATPAASVRLARRLSDTHTRPPLASPVALGVMKGARKTDFVLGARIHARGAEAELLRDRVLKASKGEARVRIVPEVRKRAPSPAWFKRRRRPLEAGLSVGHVDVTAGTLGFIVDDADAYYVLSNNHVLANVNRGEPGDLIVQPGPLDPPGQPGTSPDEFIGVLDRFVPISFQRANLVDCAVAELHADLEFYSGWTEALPGVVRGIAPLTIDDLDRPVKKAGRTTGVTSGRITQVEVDRLQVDMADPGAPPQIAQFSDQIEVQGDGGDPFSQPGDSGSLIVDGRGRAVALLFSGGPSDDGLDLTFANRIETVLAKLGVALTL
jgi:hypothetical protein